MIKGLFKHERQISAFLSMNCCIIIIAIFIDQLHACMNISSLLAFKPSKSSLAVDSYTCGYTCVARSIRRTHRVLPLVARAQRGIAPIYLCHLMRKPLSDVSSRPLWSSDCPVEACVFYLSWLAIVRSRLMVSCLRFGYCLSGMFSVVFEYIGMIQ